MPERKEIEYAVNKNGCWICTSHKAFGKPIAYPRMGKRLGETLIHRYMYKKHNGVIPYGLVVRHKCDNPLCINPKHLEIGTRADNNQDRAKRNRSAKGVKHERSKLTEENVKEIFFSKDGAVFLSKKFGVKHAQIWKIRQGITWTYLTKKFS